MLERVSVHQTRLRVPGVGLDGRGVALGARGLVLLPSVDRLATFLALYTSESALGELGRLRLEVVRSELGITEMALSFDAPSSDLLDRVSDIAHLAGGFTFTGSSRHFVQFRDASAPFGYDAPQITATDAPLCLYHSTFSQTYQCDRQIELRALLMRMQPTRERPGAGPASERVLLAESGLGPALVSYLARSGVDARATVVESKPESDFDDQPTRRWVFRAPVLPTRIERLFSETPGVSVFCPACPGVAVELGFRHPVHLASSGVFDPAALVLFRGLGLPPLEIESLPSMGEVSTLEGVSLGSELHQVAVAGAEAAQALRTPLHLTATGQGIGTIAAAFISPEELRVLRRLAYAFGRDVIATTRIAVTPRGAFVVRDEGLEGIPVGRFFRRAHPRLFVPSGFELHPAVRPEALFASLGAPDDMLVFFERSTNHQARAVGLADSAFTQLDEALLGATDWTVLEASWSPPDLDVRLPTVTLEPLGFFPFSDAEAETEYD